MEQTIQQRIAAIRRGNVPTGYRKIKRIGIFPEKWSKTKIGDFIQFYNEKSTKNNQYPVLTSARSGLFFQKDYFEDQVTTENNTGYNIIPRGFFTYRSRSDDGSFYFNCNTIIDRGVISCFYPVFQFDTTKVDSNYIFICLNELLKEQVFCEVAGTSQLVLSEKMLSQMTLVLPPLDEQRRIAEILWCCDRVIALKKELIAEKKKQKKALMQKLLNPDSGFRLPGFSGDWNTCFLRDLYDFKKSTSIPRSQLGNSGVAYLHYGDIHKSTKYHIDVLKKLNDLPKLSTTDDYSKYMLLNGDVVFVDASEDYDGVSKYTVIKNPTSIPFIAGLHTIVARSKNNLLAIDFQQFCFQNECVKQQFFFYASGMKVFGLNAENLGKIKISIPSTDEQQAIADILSAADKEIDLLEQELAQQEQKKKSLMQLLLTGTVRV